MVRLANIHSLTDFKRNTAAFMRRLKKSRTPEVLTVNGEARLVVMDAETYEQMVASFERADAIEGIRRGLEDAKAGRVLPAKRAFDMIRMKHKIPERG
jgi:PHD/YefM family antitoxin component YafN of YafNO toxin-antitoxin module